MDTAIRDGNLLFNGSLQVLPLYIPFQFPRIACAHRSGPDQGSALGHIDILGNNDDIDYPGLPLSSPLSSEQVSPTLTDRDAAAFSVEGSETRSACNSLSSVRCL